MVAIQMNNLDMVELLLKAGADANWQDWEEGTPLT